MKGALLLPISLVLWCSASAFVVDWDGSLNINPPPAINTPCKTPLLWEGRYSEWNHNAATNNRYTISFDGVKKRKWIEEERKSMRPGRRLFKFLILFEQQITYQIDLTFNRCTVIPTEPWRNFSIPPTALYEDNYLVGGPEGKLNVTEWSDRQPARSRESWIGGFTRDGCWPVFDIFTFTNSSVSIAYTTRFFDLQPDIKNMSVFNVPDICKQLTTENDSIPEPDGKLPSFWDRWTPNWLKKMLGIKKIDDGGITAGYEIIDTEKPEATTLEVKPPTYKPTNGHHFGYHKTQRNNI